MKKVVLIGGGFAGLNFIRSLGTQKDIQVTLVDRNNYHFFPPLLYQVATGYLQPSSISYPFRKLLQDYPQVRFQMGEVIRIEAEEQKLVLSSGTLDYDYLIIATGATSNYFGNTTLQQAVRPMKTVNEALELRNHILTQLEKAAVTTNYQLQNKLMTIVIAGGGPTGVEVSGMLAKMKKSILAKDYPELSAYAVTGKIILVDGSDKVLKPMSDHAQNYTLESLKALGVEVILNCQVKGYSNEVVQLSNGTNIESATLIWAAGVTVDGMEGIPSSSYTRGHRLNCNEFNEITGMKNIYAIGDASYQSHDVLFPNGHPQLAQVAIQQGKHLAENIKRIENNQPSIPFYYHNKGSMAIIGSNRAVVDFPKGGFLSGWTAWITWLIVHLFSLMTSRNRVVTFIGWAGIFFTRDQALRMIFRPNSYGSSEH